MFATPSAAADGLGLPRWKRLRRPAALFCTRSKFEELLEALKGAPNAEELLGGKVKPESPEETVATYVSAAKGLGLELSAEDVIEGIKVKVQERLAKTDEAVIEAAELSEDQLDKVAGGEILTQCEDTLSRGRTAGSPTGATTTSRGTLATSARMTMQTRPAGVSETARKPCSGSKRVA